MTEDRQDAEPVASRLLSLTGPLVLQNLVLVGQELVDVFWLGRLSVDAVAAVGLLSPVLTLLFSLVVSTPYTGTHVLVSQRHGADDATGVRRATFAGLVVALAVGAVVGTAVFAASPALVDIATLLDVSAVAGSVPTLAVAYLQVVVLGLPLLAASDVLEATMVGQGDSRATLYVNVVAVTGNLTLDPLLIFGYGPFPALGVAGAAVATLAGTAAGFALAVAFAAGSRGNHALSRESVALDAGTLRRVLELGVPSALKGAARGAANVLLVALVFATGGVAGLAAYAVGNRATTLASLPSLGLQKATQTMVGQSVGAEDRTRARETLRVAVAAAVTVLTAVGVFQWVFATEVALFFAPEFEGRSLALTTLYLHALAVGYPALGAFFTLQGSFNGVGRTKLSMAFTMVQYWLVRLPVSAVGALTLGHGVAAVFVAKPLSFVLVAAASATLLLRHRFDVLSMAVDTPGSTESG